MAVLRRVRFKKGLGRPRRQRKGYKYQSLVKYNRRTQRIGGPVVAIGGQVNHAFPRMMKFRHRYVELLSLTAASGVTGTYNFSCNGMFDPNITGTGKQPMCFDQMTALYDHYVVIGSKIIVKATNHTTSQPPSYVSIFINDDTSNAPGSAAAYIANDRTYTIVPAGGVKQGIVSARWSAKKIFGKGVLANTDLQGTSAANPNEQSYYSINYGSVDQTTTAIVDIIVDIEYIAIWKEPRDIDLS